MDKLADATEIKAEIKDVKKEELKAAETNSSTNMPDGKSVPSQS